MSKIEDRELLELAAKAGGVRFPRWLESSFYGPTLSTCDSVDADGERVNEVPWNPLTDDGDALRLMVELGLLVAVFEEAEFMRQHIEVSREGIDVYQRHEGGKLSATRRAIVRAAAEIGRLMC